MAPRPAATETTPDLLRIGEVAQRTGVTTRTLRYWEELKLVEPSSYSAGGERRYSPTDLARVNRIRNLQELLGFSLAEVRAVLSTEDVDVLDRVRSTINDDTLSVSRRRALLDEGITANDQLLARLDATLARIQAFRDERVASGTRMRAKRRLLDEDAT
jgi:MerR family transcriptional regulator, repressor of the yfmOP operon